MKLSSALAPALFCWGLLTVLVFGCEESTNVVTTPPSGAGGSNSGGAGGKQSGSGGNIFVGGGGPGGGQSTGGGTGDPCGTGNPTCQEPCIGPTCDPPGEFPLPTDDPAPGNVDAEGVTRDDDGYIVLDSTSSQSDFLWVALDRSYSVGMVSKIQTTPFPTAPTYREVGRYVSVTCFSDSVRGSKEGIVLGQLPPAGLCADGVHGCCSRAEVAPGANGGHQPVQTVYNRPSRTAVDKNGDVWVANRAHTGPGGYRRASATKIAASLSDCIDRNGNGQIDTSSDVNDDGIITTDCDDNNLPDDIDTVCTGGMSHEFFGLDDECILFTVNLEDNGWGRPLTLGPGEGGPSDPSDAWAGMHQTGRFYRIDGATGAIKTTVQLTPQNNVTPTPYGAVVDQFGILWTPHNWNNPHLFYFDTNNPSDQGMVAYPGASPVGQHYGIAVDGYTDPNTTELVQQIWLGEVGTSGGCRYRPVRDGTFASLASGEWACAYFAGGVSQGRGIGVDNRQPTSFAWVALDGYASGNSVSAVGRIPVDINPSQTTSLAVTDTFSTGTEYGVTGAGVAADGDIWAVAQDQNALGSKGSVIHWGVAPDGTLTSGPDVVPLDDKPGAANNFCPLGTCKPFPYTYSDFTGFGLANFVTPNGYYSWIESSNCLPGRTRFLRVEWDAEQSPPDTQITMIARSAPDLTALETATWTGAYAMSPADLSAAPGPLDPNPSDHIEVLFELTSAGVGTPRLKSFKIVYECEDVIPN